MILASHADVLRGSSRPGGRLPLARDILCTKVLWLLLRDDTDGRTGYWNESFLKIQPQALGTRLL